MSWEVELKRSGKTFVVEDSETVLAAALRNHIGLPYGCRDGACGSCRARLLSGDVEYGEQYPTALQGDDVPSDSVILCQARPKSRLVIDAEELNMVAGLEPRILPCRVVALNRLAHDVMGVELKLPQNQRLRYLAGQYIDILLSGGKRRSYSLANSPDNDEHLHLHIRQVEGGLFTTHVFTSMKEKELLRMRGPMGTFFVRPDNTEPVILVAGGTGYAPMQAILEQQLADTTSRPISLYWGARSLHDLYRHEQCLQWAREYKNFRYIPVLSEPQSGDNWQGQTGWVHDAVLRDHAELSGYQVYAAGPPVMVKAVKKAFLAAGLRSDRLYSDSFEFAGDHEA